MVDLSAIAGRLRGTAAAAEGTWFDLSRGVHTAGYVPLHGLTLAGADQSGCDYLPARPATVRRALRDLPIRDHAGYTFIDLGSGRGRVLFLAAELPFRRILGVELAAELHRQALDNIARFEHYKRRCPVIESVNLDASDFEFPGGNLVVCLFNPFGPAVMEKVLAGLARSLKASPRHALLELLYPEPLAPVMRAAAPVFQPYRLSPAYHIYQSG